MKNFIFAMVASITLLFGGVAMACNSNYQLTITNDSTNYVMGVFVSCVKCGDNWSDNLLYKPINPGVSQTFDLTRAPGALQGETNFRLIAFSDNGSYWGQPDANICEFNVWTLHE